MSLEDLFAEAARAMYSETVEDIESVEPRISREIRIEGEDTLVDLFKEWLSELVFITDSEGLLFSEFKVEINKHSPISLSATVMGEKLSAKRHNLKRLIKSVTYHQLSISEECWGWLARIVFDI